MAHQFYLTRESSAKLLEESEAHSAYLSQLREARDRRGAPPMQFAGTTMQGVLDDAEERGDVRKFTGDTLTGFGDIGDRGSDRWREVMDEERAYQLREERAARDEAGL